MLVDIMDDSVGKQLKELVKIERFAIEQWFEEYEKPITESINNYKLFLFNKPTDKNHMHSIRQKSNNNTKRNGCS